VLFACLRTIPVNVLQNYAHQIQVELENVKANSDVDVTPLHNAIFDLSKAASYIRQESEVFHSFKPDASDIFYFLLRRRAINDRLMLAERSFLDSDGLPGPGRGWYKHLVSNSFLPNIICFSVYCSVFALKPVWQRIFLLRIT
jgi:hypothetical protein